jgi:hypothetical protein
VPKESLMAEPNQEAINLQQLNASMIRLEEERLRRVEERQEPAAVTDRETAQKALNVVVAFFLDHSIESTPLVRLLSALSALSAGSRLPNMFEPLPASNRRPDSPGTEGIKGRLAAIAEYLQRSGKSRRAATRQVVELLTLTNAPLPKPTSATVDSWLVKWGGNRGAKDGAGREGYLAMRSILKDTKPSADQMKRIVKIILGHLS